MNNFIQTVLSRKSVRDFTGEPIAKEDLELIVKAGMAAPSAVNTQPWAFIIVTEKNKLLNLSRKLPYAKMLTNAAAAIIVCGVPEKDTQFAPIYWVCDCSAATENILLAAHSMNLGAVWTAVYPEKDRIAHVRNECKIPENIIPLNVIPIGVPGKSLGKAVDKFKQENIHWDSW